MLAMLQGGMHPSQVVEIFDHDYLWRPTTSADGHIIEEAFKGLKELIASLEFNDLPSIQAFETMQLCGAEEDRNLLRR